MSSRFRNFVTCHCHPGSLDSGSTPEAFADREVALETGALCVTDHGTLQTSHQVYSLAKEKGLIPIIGIEAYFRDNECSILAANGYEKNERGGLIGAPKYMHISLHALDYAAYKCMVRLISRADLRLEADKAQMEPAHRKMGSERKALFRWADLEELGQHNVTAGSGCFVPGTLVQTGDGLSPIENIASGAIVTDKDGAKRKVAIPTQREWNGRVVKVNTTGSFHDVVATDDHLFIRETYGEPWKWVPAGDLRKNDEIRLSVEQRPNLTSLPFTHVYESPVPRHSKRIVGNYADPDTLWVIGFFLAEGSFGSKGDATSIVNFSTHTEKDKESRARVRAWALKHGATSVGESQKLGMGTEQWVSSRVIADWFLTLFGGRTASHTKKIPDVIKDLHPDLLRHLCLGYFDGDGHIKRAWTRHIRSGNCRTKKLTAATTSIQLADDILAIFRRIGARYRLNVVKGGVRKDGIRRKESYYIRAAGKDAEYLWRWMRGDMSHVNLSGNYSSRINKISSEAYSGQVHCLVVDGEPSFSLAGGAVVHNCMAGMVKRHILDNDDHKTALQYFDRLRATFKPGNFFAELNPHDTSHDWIAGVFITMSDGTVHKLYDGKVVMTDAGEIRASQLAKEWPFDKHHVLKSIKDRSKWREMPEAQIVKVEAREGFERNECKKWSPDGNYEAGLNHFVCSLAKRRQVPVIIGDDSHYATPEAAIVQDVRLAQHGPWKFYTGGKHNTYHRMSSDEAWTQLQTIPGVTEKEFEGWIANSHEWASRFKDFTFESRPSLPTKFYEAEYKKRPWYVAGKTDNSVRYTMELIRKHGRMKWDDPKYVTRLRKEIDLLHGNGTIDLLPYFMIDEEACAVYERAELLSGPGRGSAAGCLITYLLGITHVNPLRYNLSLDRFLTKDRIASGKMPDIDQDVGARDLLTGGSDYVEIQFEDGTKKIVRPTATVTTDVGDATVQEAFARGLDVRGWA